MAENIETRISSEQAKEAIYQAHLSKDAIEKIEGLVASDSEIDNMVTNGATQADLDALALSTGNLTASQVATIDNLSGLTSDAATIDGSVSNVNKLMGTSFTRGQLTFGTYATTTPSGWTILDTVAAPSNCFLDSLTVVALASGKIEVSSFSQSGTTLTRENYIYVDVYAGTNTYTNDNFKELYVKQGWFVGIRTIQSGILAANVNTGTVNILNNSNKTSFAYSTYAVQFPCNYTFVSLNETTNSSKVNKHLNAQLKENLVTNDFFNDPYKDIVPDSYIFCLAIGQSNTVGYAATLPEIYFSEGQAYKYTYNTTTLVSDLVLLDGPSGYISTTNGSFAQAFAKKIQTLSQGKIGLIIANIAVGGTGISYWIPGGAGNTLISTHLPKALAAAKNKSLPIIGCCTYWMQGEGDAANLKTKEYYKTNFLSLKSSIDGYIGAKVPFLMTRIGSTELGDPTTGYAVIREAQDEIIEEVANVFCSNSSAYYISLGGGMNTSNDVHFSIDGYNEIGESTGQVAMSVAIGHRPKGYKG